ncbi:unnamed protein product [Kuraishia capsulata CBS 1993]|uniref:Single-stranded DNA-binding protein RIM1, mitochondrial n=1 Tax=Kuraishia capsulata CBS 1993 TaxID=1382522 RepID=W6MKK1_9ASCO|nr:uncharacterized protein KUCA_T00002485001 [Kuraishia capsulata CBS 1993]CDK26513.1 unnamed protein product [Kuraishia capsulata CBS 1993]
MLSRQFARGFSSTSKNAMAKMSLIGTIGSDLEQATTSTGKEYLKYSVAVNGGSKDAPQTSWFKIAVFNPTEIKYMNQYLGKGAKVYLEADVSNNSYEKADGTRATSLMLFQTNLETIKFPKRDIDEAESATA